MQAPKSLSQMAQQPWIAQTGGRAGAARQPAGHEQASGKIGVNEIRAESPALDRLQGAEFGVPIQPEQANRRRIEANCKPLLATRGQPRLVPSPAPGKPANVSEAPKPGDFRGQPCGVQVGRALRQER